MDSQDLLAALAPVLTDADARARFLADPRAVLEGAGLALPDWFKVTAREGVAPELSITIPPMVDLDVELSEENLVQVGGGYLGCDAWENWPPK